MASKYVEKKSPEEELQEFNFRVLQKQIRTIKRIETVLSFGVVLVYD